MPLRGVGVSNQVVTGVTIRLRRPRTLIAWRRQLEFPVSYPIMSPRVGIQGSMARGRRILNMKVSSKLDRFCQSNSTQSFRS